MEIVAKMLLNYVWSVRKFVRGLNQEQENINFRVLKDNCDISSPACN